VLLQYFCRHRIAELAVFRAITARKITPSNYDSLRQKPGLTRTKKSVGHARNFFRQRRIFTHGWSARGASLSNESAQFVRTLSCFHVRTPARTSSVRFPVPLEPPAFRARSEPPVPQPTDSPNDRIASAYQHHLRRDGKSIHTGRREFSGVSVRAQNELDTRRLRIRTYHPAFAARASRAELALTQRSDSNQAVAPIVPFGHPAIFARGQLDCESKHYPSRG
jgi:hypothetical protein